MKLPNENQKVFINVPGIIGLEAVYKDGMFWGSLIGKLKLYKSENVLCWVDEAEQIEIWNFCSNEKPKQGGLTKAFSLLDEDYQQKWEATESWRKQKTKHMGGGDDLSLDYWMNDMDNPN